MPASRSLPTKSAITVRDLRKTYVVPEREAGLKAALGSLVRRRTREVEAVREISFDIAPGEIVGFLGPNGAGKTTTLKMLSGLLHPTSGDVDVLGFTPWERDRAYLRQMALIMGQRNQLQWDIPVIDSYQLNKAIFQISDTDYRQRLDELVDWLDLADLINKPVRNLSLGERMKCEIAGSLLHYPKILYLDEPTIGLDVAMQRKIRSFVAEYNARTGASVMLTSHYMGDVEALCKRVIVIHHGTLLYDGDLVGLSREFAPQKTIAVEFEPDASVPDVDLTGLLPLDAEIISRSEAGMTLTVPKAETAHVASRLLAELPVADLTIEEPPFEEVIEKVFASEERAVSSEVIVT
ncbi:MAG TPA: ATP-binding cassette domain-containing protein [Thermomicrobiales bacterium]|nr:ATP-binding cassette domain-containing protein [Thermomicrobiales bacterium]